MKGSLLTDAAGIPLSVVIDGANRHDVKLAADSKRIADRKAAAYGGRGARSVSGQRLREPKSQGVSQSNRQRAAYPQPWEREKIRRRKKDSKRNVGW